MLTDWQNWDRRELRAGPLNNSWALWRWLGARARLPRGGAMRARPMRVDGDITPTLCRGSLRCRARGNRAAAEPRTERSVVAIVLRG